MDLTTFTAEKERWAIFANFDLAELRAQVETNGTRTGVQREVTVAPLHAVFAASGTANGELEDTAKPDIRFVLVRAEDLLEAAPWRLAVLQRQSAQAFNAGVARFGLPNGMEVAHLRTYETRYLYEEIFVQQSYLKNGIELNDGGVIFDVGANIGMFSLFVSQHCHDAKIYAFEPSPVTCQVLRANLERHAPGATIIQAGLAEADRDARFTFYPESSVFSGFHAGNADRTALRAIITNELSTDQRLHGRDINGYIEALIEHRFEQQTYDCRLRSLSSVMRELDIDHIDLLKVDAEKCEEAIFNGIRAGDWPKIRQIVVEVHDGEGLIGERICAKLRANGFEVAVIEEPMLRESGFRNIYGTRLSRRQRDMQGEWKTRADHGLRELARLLDSSTLGANGVAPVFFVAPSSEALVTRVPSGFIEAIESRLEQIQGVRSIDALSGGARLDALVQSMEALAATVLRHESTVPRLISARVQGLHAAVTLTGEGTQA